MLAAVSTTATGISADVTPEESTSEPLGRRSTYFMEQDGRALADY